MNDRIDVVCSDTSIWEGAGIANHFSFPTNDATETFFEQSLKLAQQLKDEKIRDEHIVKLAAASLAQHNVEFPIPPTTYDTDDVIGLIGEILLAEFIARCNFQPILVKWKINGTSKSRGIDLIAKNGSREETSLRLLESKHAHRDVKGKPLHSCHHSFRARFRQGIDEFEKERTITNLARVARHLSRLCRMAEAAGADTKELKHAYRLIETKLKTRDYSVQIAVATDSRYCDATTIGPTVSPIGRPLTVGDHLMWLTLVACADLEAFTEKLCEKFVG